MLEAFALPYVQRAALELLLLAVVAGLLGPWIVLRALSFHAHAIGVSTFPGLVLADGLSLAPQALAFGAAGIFTALSSALGRLRNATTDAVTALVLVGCLAAGVILASDVFASGANVDSLLFGSLLSIGTGDLVFAAATAILAVLASTLLGRHWLARGFDEQGATEFGSGSRWFDAALLVAVAVAVIATLNAIGALLVIALLVIPAATARLVTRRIRTLQACTLVLVVLEGTFGIWLAVETNVPPGATIAVISGVVFGLVAIGKVVRSNRNARRGIAVAGVLVAGGTFIVGCSSTAGQYEGEPREISAIATTTQVADLVRQVGGDRVELTQLLQPNTDPHEYEPRPSDIEAFPDADVIFINGGHLDEWVEQLVEDSGSDARLVDLGATIPVKLEEGEQTHTGEGGELHGHRARETDSHWWHDPTNVGAAVTRVAGVLGQLEPGQRKAFERNAIGFRAEIESLDRAISACLKRIPAGDRKLVTDHGAFSYLANRYGLEIIGTVIPALTTQAEPSAGDLAELDRTIESENVRAIFPESSVPSTTAEAIARDTGASAEYVLYGDTLGPVESEAGTYVGMMQANVDQIARGLSGGKVTCEFG